MARKNKRKRAGSIKIKDKPIEIPIDAENNLWLILPIIMFGILFWIIYWLFFRPIFI